MKQTSTWITHDSAPLDAQPRGRVAPKLCLRDRTSLGSRRLKKRSVHRLSVPPVDSKLWCESTRLSAAGSGDRFRVGLFGTWRIYLTIKT